MPCNEFYSTGDVSGILNISRATVSRKFDAGVLEGKKNPITGERLISHESLLSFMKKYNIPQEAIEVVSSKYLVLLCSNNKHLKSQINLSFPPEGIVKIIETESIFDAIIMFTKNPPKLFIIDDDYPCADIVKSLKQHEFLKQLKIICYLKKYNKKKMKEINADEYLFRDTLSITNLMNKISTILNIPNESQNITSFDHNRLWPRISTSIPANLEIHFENAVQSPEFGNTRIENISFGGAYLNNIYLDRGKIPLKDFSLYIETDQPPLVNWKTECKIVRVQINGSFNAGVSFVELSEKNRNQISKLIE